MRAVGLIPWQRILNERRIHGLFPVDHWIPIQSQLIQYEQVACSDLIVKSALSHQSESSTIAATVACGVSAPGDQPEIVDGLPESPEGGGFRSHFNVTVELASAVGKDEFEYLKSGSIDELLTTGFTRWQQGAGGICSQESSSDILGNVKLRRIVEIDLVHANEIHCSHVNRCDRRWR